MENKIFKEMMQMGWNLGDNELEDFKSVLETHIEKMEYMLDAHYNEEGARIDLRNWTAYISREEIKNIFEFMLDFAISVKNIDRIEGKYEKIKENV